MKITVKKLKNGITVAVCSFPQLQSVGINIGVKYGSVDENPKINGSAHFLEHMLFKGTTKRNWKKQNEFVRSIGAYSNAYTDYESTTYQIMSYKAYFKDSLDLISDMLTNSILPPKEFESERGPIINENLIQEDNPRYFARDYLPKALFKKHPARMPIGGNNKTTINKITRYDLFDIYKKHYTPENMVVAVYGGIHENNAIKLVSKYLKNFKGINSELKRPMAREKQIKTERIFSRVGTKQARIAVGFKTSEFRNTPEGIREYLSILVASDLLSYRLYEQIREKRGLSYDPSSYSYMYSTFGFIAAEAGVEPSKLNQTKGIILDEFQKLENGDITKEEVKKTINKIRITYKMARESSWHMASLIASSQLTYGDPKFTFSIPEIIGNIHLNDVKAACKKYIDADKYSMVMLKPKD
ncbi:MAG: M16 family metallopeptidase [Candidatus Micrarchaeaceae archaeon]